MFNLGRSVFSETTSRNSKKWRFHGSIRVWNENMVEILKSARKTLIDLDWTSQIVKVNISVVVLRLRVRLIIIPESAFFISVSVGNWLDIVRCRVLAYHIRRRVIVIYFYCNNAGHINFNFAREWFVILIVPFGVFLS